MLKEKEIPSFKLNDKTIIPAIGFGTGNLRGENCLTMVKEAIDLGYRHIDTADIYKNHREIGRAIKEIPRQEIFLTTKYYNSSQEGVDISLDRFLEELNTDYVDLLLLHCPVETSLLAEVLKSMEEIRKEGKIKAIGVSNFNIVQLNEALKTEVNIANDQIEFHPSLNETEFQNFCKINKVIVTAYSPLGQGKDLSIGVVKEIAGKHNATPAQVILAWHLQQGRIVIPSSKNKDHARENIECLKIELAGDELEQISYIGQY